jgi:hypothetical protein
MIGQGVMDKFGEELDIFSEEFDRQVQEAGRARLLPDPDSRLSLHASTAIRIADRAILYDHSGPGHRKVLVVQEWAGYRCGWCKRPSRRLLN